MAAEQVDQDGFWASLWRNTEDQAINIPINARVDEGQISAYLDQEIIPRYVTTDVPVQPIPGTTNFTTGSEGQRLIRDQAQADIRTALLSPDSRQVSLQTQRVEGSGPSMEVLQAFLMHNLDWVGFKDLAEIYLESLDGQAQLHFAVQNGQLVVPDIAFSAASFDEVIRR